MQQTCRNILQVLDNASGLNFWYQGISRMWTMGLQFQANCPAFAMITALVVEVFGVLEGEVLCCASCNSNPLLALL